MNCASCRRNYLAIYFFQGCARHECVRKVCERSVRRFYVQYFSPDITKQRTYKRGVALFVRVGRITRHGQRHIGIGFQTVAQGQKGFHPRGQKGG